LKGGTFKKTHDFWYWPNLWIILSGCGGHPGKTRDPTYPTKRGKLENHRLKKTLGPRDMLVPKSLLVDGSATYLKPMRKMDHENPRFRGKNFKKN